MSNSITAYIYYENSTELNLNIESRVRCNIILSLAEKCWGFKLWEDFETWLFFLATLESWCLNPTLLYRIHNLLFWDSYKLQQLRNKSVHQPSPHSLFFKHNSILPAMFIELSAGVSKYKQNKEYIKSTFLAFYFLLSLSRMAIVFKVLKVW